ncbi:MAG TPA: glyoxalase [Cytophagales bacterium]|nr:glyoxalase [Cytophagales bacterium]HAA22286.1 glyoxalase [Cytophagales bacterium]HAP57961.1 glyoxalase [Cytophagales bacterium]
MIQRMTHASVYVIDQARAEDFYVNKLGLELKMKVPLGEDAYWLTLSPREQPELELTLMPIHNPNMFDPETAASLAKLVEAGTFGFGVFATQDVFATYQELKAKGVEFTKEPKEEFYGIEAMFKDDSGNWFSLTQFKAED